VVNDVDSNKNHLNKTHRTKRETEAFLHESSGNGKNPETRKALLRQQREQLKEQGL
jgi:hypothetical protein